MIRWGEIEHWHDGLDPNQQVDGEEKAALLEQTKEQQQILKKILASEKCLRKTHYQGLLEAQNKRHNTIVRLPHRKAEEKDGKDC